MKDFSPHIFRVQRYSIHDGPGIRTTLFFQGCPLSCAWCHNPESQAVTDGDTAPADLVRNLMAEIEKDLIYYDDSGGGVTFSGGEPLCRPVLLGALLSACRDREIHTCLDTSGYAPFEVLEPAAQSADLVLYDLKILDRECHLKRTGRPPGRILRNLERLSVQDIPVRLRFPLVPAMTDAPENIEQIIAFLLERTAYREIHVLPFHATGAGKYDALGRENPAAGIVPPEPARIEAAARRFTDNGFKVHIGG